MAWDLRSFGGKIYPGRYTFTHEMTYSDLVVFLRSGQIDEITITFNNVRTLEQLAKKVGGQIEATEREIRDELNNLVNMGMIKKLSSLFIPNTYKMFWNTTGEGFVKRMVKEHKKFWNKDQCKKGR